VSKWRKSSRTVPEVDPEETTGLAAPDETLLYTLTNTLTSCDSRVAPKCINTANSSKCMVLLGFLLSAALAADPVSVAIMHSQTGTMSFSEIPVINAEILAIEEINAKGGVLGRQIAYKIFDGASIPTTFKLKAEQIVDNTSYVTTFGCWTSSSRKAVKPVFEAANALLWYPVHYEGQECSKNIFYSGATPNQQIEPSVNWLLEKYTAKQIFLVGSDYIFPRTVNTIVKAMLKQLGGDLVGEAYVPLPKDDAESASNNVMLRGYLVQLNATYPNGCVIYNSLHGDANVQLFAHMSDLGMGPDKYPTMSVLISEAETEPIGVSKLVGHCNLC
jgi:urea transport system substrate-binding protein